MADDDRDGGDGDDKERPLFGTVPCKRTLDLRLLRQSAAVARDFRQVPGLALPVTRGRAGQRALRSCTPLQASTRLAMQAADP